MILLRVFGLRPRHNTHIMPRNAMERSESELSSCRYVAVGHMHIHAKWPWVVAMSCHVVPCCTCDDGIFSFLFFCFLVLSMACAMRTKWKWIWQNRKISHRNVIPAIEIYLFNGFYAKLTNCTPNCPIIEQVNWADQRNKWWCIYWNHLIGRVAWYLAIKFIISHFLFFGLRLRLVDGLHHRAVGRPTNDAPLLYT